MQVAIALLRGINVGGNNQIAMAALRELAVGLGWHDVQTYIASGNLIFRAAGTTAELAAALEDAIAARFGLAIPVVVRGAAEWAAYRDSNPFREESEHTPNLVMLGVAKAPPLPGAVEALQARAQAGERIAQTGDGIWLYFPDGSARTKLSPAFFDRTIGSPFTTRNWRTVVKLAELTAPGPV
jgi:uncharacterized protein (DUF1697 family)